MNRGDAAAATRIYQRIRVAAAPRLRREYSAETGARLRYALRTLAHRAAELRLKEAVDDAAAYSCDDEDASRAAKRARRLPPRLLRAPAADAISVAALAGAYGGEAWVRGPRGVAAGSRRGRGGVATATRPHGRST